MVARADYVAALRRERAHVLEQYGDGAPQVDLIDAELARFEDRPAISRREVAVPRPIRKR